MPVPDISVMTRRLSNPIRFAETESVGHGGKIRKFAVGSSKRAGRPDG
jgi:hypothetical protein